MARLAAIAMVLGIVAMAGGASFAFAESGTCELAPADCIANGDEDAIQDYRDSYSDAESYAEWLEDLLGAEGGSIGFVAGTQFATRAGILTVPQVGVAVLAGVGVSYLVYRMWFDDDAVNLHLAPSAASAATGVFYSNYVNGGSLDCGWNVGPGTGDADVFDTNCVNYTAAYENIRWTSLAGDYCMELVGEGTCMGLVVMTRLDNGGTSYWPLGYGDAMYSVEDDPNLNGSASPVNELARQYTMENYGVAQGGTYGPVVGSMNDTFPGSGWPDETGYGVAMTNADYLDWLGGAVTGVDTSPSVNSDDVAGSQEVEPGEPSDGDIATAAGEASPCEKAVINYRLAPGTYPITSVQEACEAGAGDPGGTPQPQTIEMPDVDPGETYAAYVARLRAAGWVGTATVIDPSEDACMFGDWTGLPDGTLVAVVPNLCGGASWDWYWRMDPSEDVESEGFPRSIPRSRSIVFYRNPGNEGAEPPVTPPDFPPPGGDGCAEVEVGSIDWTPLQGIPFGTVFPFGIFAWVGDGLDDMTEDGEAPSFTVEMHGQEMNVDLAVLDPAMPTIRAALLFAATLLLIWGLATAFLGLGRGGGDD